MLCICPGYTHAQESHENSLEGPKLISLAEPEGSAQGGTKG